MARAWFDCVYAFAPCDALRLSSGQCRKLCNLPACKHHAEAAQDADQQHGGVNVPARAFFWFGHGDGAGMLRVNLSAMLMLCEVADVNASHGGVR